MISAAHTDDDVAQTVEAVGSALPAYRKALETGTVAGLVEGRPVAPPLRSKAHPRRL